jgi:RepB DNA-primase N-terminal domain
MIDAIIAWVTHPNLNIYASYAILRKDLPPGTRGGEADVRAVLALVGDLDADIGKTGVGLNGLPLQPTYVVETSADNFHAVFPLERALLPSDAKPIAVALSDAIGGDSGTKDVSHLWRIPGTLNWPSAKKLARGRPKTPQLVTIKSA